MNRYIDHTCLKQGATKKDILTLCQEANEHKFKAVCVPPSYVKLSKLVLSPWEVRKHIAHNQANLYEYILMEDSGVKVCTVIGFPLGYSSTASKAIEIKNALIDGADEIDIVQNISAVKDDDFDYIKKEMEHLLKVAKQNQWQKELTVKVILETGVLSDFEVAKCCEIYSKFQDLNFIKTSTGTTEIGATLHHVDLISHFKGAHQQIKASGGVRTKDFAEELIKHGVTRLGTSSGVKLMANEKITGNY